MESELDTVFPPVWFLNSGNLGLNYILSGRLDGGWPSGTAEVFGQPSTGKTLLLIKAVAEMQKVGGLTIVNDVEHAWDWEFARHHRVNPDKVLKDYPETIEDFTIRTLKILDQILEQDPIPRLLIVLDSIAAISTNWEMESQGTKEDQGKKAKRIKAAMRVLPKKIAKAGAILLISNHLIANPKITYGSPYETPGGKGVFFQANVRVELSKTLPISIEGKQMPRGVTLRLTCTKNRFRPPFGETEMDMLWSTGVSQYSGLLNMMLDLGIVQQGGGWYNYKDKKFRASDLDEFITQNPEILNDEKWERPYFLEA